MATKFFAPKISPPAAQVIDFGTGKTPQPYDDFLNAAFADLEIWWAEVLPQVYGIPFEPVSAIYALYPEREGIPVCGDTLTYDLVEGNAFYLGCADLIAYDDTFLLPDLATNLGNAAVAVVAAHEYGHAVQNRAGIFDLDLPVVDTEQQADCMAGAWTARMARGESDFLTFGDQDVKGGIIAMIEVRDPPGLAPVTEGNGHGTAFDRVGAFQEGFLNGPQRCADFLTNPNPRIDLTFMTQEEIDTGGNLPIEEIIDALPLSLDTFWQPTLSASGVPFTPPALAGFPNAGPYPECDGLTGDQLQNTARFCASTNTIVYDSDFVIDLYNRLGDVSLSYPIANAYSDAVQAALGSGLGGEPRVLLNDCLVGAWLVDIIPTMTPSQPGAIEPTNPAQQIVLSAGDLDEVVITAVILGDEAMTTDVVGTAFEKIDAFRTGVLEGLGGCQSRLG